MRTKCPVCKKNFDMMHPSLWAYNINKKHFFCSWKCLQKHRAQEEEMKLKITLEQKKKAVEIAVNGGDVMAFLRECGSENPGVTWSNIYRTLEKVDPEAYDLITCRKKAKVDKGMPKKDDLPVVKVDGPLKIETLEGNLVTVAEVPEKAKINQPLMHSGKKAIGWEGDFGNYIYDRKHGYIDYESNDGEEISMPVDAWREWLKEIGEIAQLMGVEL